MWKTARSNFKLLKVSNAVLKQNLVVFSNIKISLKKPDLLVSLKPKNIIQSAMVLDPKGWLRKLS